MIRWIAACAAAMALAGAAWADMKAFNAAVKAGDYKTAAAEAETVWKTWNKADRDTAVVAREFGFASLIAGRYDLARQFGQFLMDSGATLPVPDDQPKTSAVLFRIADFKASKSNDKLGPLRAALTDRQNAPGIDMTSAIAWEALYVGDAPVGWPQAAQDARLAAAFYARDKGLLARQRGAEVFAASADFIAGRARVTQGKNDYYGAMADVHDAIVQDIDAASPAMAKQLWPLKWKSEAWVIAIESYLTSSYQQVGSNISTTLQTRRLKQPQYAEHQEDAILGSLPDCEGKFEGAPLRYPAGGEFRGMVGSVILRMETDATGKVTHAEIAAAVPSDGLGPALLPTVSSWTYKAAKGVDTSLCRLQSKNRYMTVTFTLG